MRKVLCLAVGMFVLIFLLGSANGCSIRSARQISGSVDLPTFLKALPDSMRQNPFGDRHGLDLSAKEIDALIAAGNVETQRGLIWRHEFIDSSHTHLRVTREGSDESLKYELVSFAAPRSAKWVLVLQTLDDHCCSFGRWALYLHQKGAWKDETGVRMPQPSWENFFSTEALGEPKPAALTGNRYPFLMQVATNPLRIELGIVADYVELSFPEGQASKMLAALPEQPISYVWWKGHFMEQNLQN